MKKVWQVYPPIEESLRAKYPEISPVILQLLKNRKIEEENFSAFLNQKFEDLFSPFSFSQMKEAVELVIKHLKQKNKIVIYGDYDADGVTATALLYEGLKDLNTEVGVYIPDRVTEGYGLNKEALDKLIEEGYNLLITVDTGIRNKEEIEYAQNKGLDVIVTDHHVLPDEKNELPNCPIIDSASEEDNYPFKKLAGVGVAFKLLIALLEESTLTQEFKDKLIRKELDLVTIGTIADLVSLEGENRILVREGLKKMTKNNLSLFNKTRVGLSELIKVSNLEKKELKSWNISFQLAPRLNAASRMDHANTAFELLTTKDRKTAKEIAYELNQRNIKRQEITKKIVEQVETEIKDKTQHNLIASFCPPEEAWSEGVVGLVAGRIAEKYYRPSLIITRAKQENGEYIFKGSGRSIEEFNLIEALNECSEFLDRYGGHTMAVGFSIYSEENVYKFIDKIKDIADKKLKENNLFPKIKIDAEMPIENINKELIKEIQALAPFGQNNPYPKFVSKGVEIKDIIKMGSANQHIKFKCFNFWALAFGKSEEYKDFTIGDIVDVVYQLEINEFNGRQESQLKIIDIKKHDKQQT